MIEAAHPHLVVAVRDRQRVVGLAEMPFAGEEGLVAGGLEHRRQRPLRRRQPAGLALEGHGGHAAAVRDASGLHGGAAGRAARLGVEGEERHPFRRQTVDVGGRHAASDAAAVGTEVAVAGVIRDDHDDVGPAGRRRRLLLLFRLRLRGLDRRCRRQSRYGGNRRSGEKHVATVETAAVVRGVFRCLAARLIQVLLAHLHAPFSIASVDDLSTYEPARRLTTHRNPR